MDKSFEVQIASDLHIEYRNDNIPNPLNYITPVAPNLILAGDIGTFYKYDQLFGFLSLLSPMFTHIIYVLGNHEYYKPKQIDGEEDITPLTFGDIKKLSNQIQNEISNLWILDNSTVRIGDYWIVGSTLWSDIRVDLPKHIVKIHGMTTDIYSAKFRSSVNFIKDEVEKCKKRDLKTIVVTHYIPSFNILPYHRHNQKYTSLYTSELDHIINTPIHTWIAGHIHSNFDTKINNVRLVSNQYGKPRDKINDFSKQFVLHF